MRQQGYTTRLIDKYIQELYRAAPGEWVCCGDHYGTHEASRRLVRMLKARLQAEHPRDMPYLEVKWDVPIPYLRLRTFIAAQPIITQTNNRP